MTKTDAMKNVLHMFNLNNKKINYHIQIYNNLYYNINWVIVSQWNFSTKNINNKYNNFLNTRKKDQINNNNKLTKICRRDILAQKLAPCFKTDMKLYSGCCFFFCAFLSNNTEKELGFFFVLVVLGLYFVWSI
jgi:hypothetical protein